MNSQREAFEKANEAPEQVWWSTACNRYVGSNELAAERYQGKWEGWQAATEQGVGDCVAVIVYKMGNEEFGEKWLHHVGDIQRFPVGTKFYTHPPKPTGGGVPGEWVMAMQRVIDWFDACNEEQDLICPREEYARIKALLATQQPPEQE